MGETKLSNRRTNRNIILSVGATLVAKLMVLLQSSVISSVFGANEGVDLIFYMMSLAVVVTTFSSAVNQLVIVSNIIHVRDNRSPQEYRQTVRFFFSLYLIVATVLAGALMLFPGQVLGALTSFEPEVIAANLGIIRVMAMVLFFSVLNTYVMDVFTSHRVFILPMVNDVIKSLAIILFILLPGQNTRIEMIVWGMLVAHIIQFLTINISFRRVFGFAVYPGFTRSMEKNAKKNVASVLLAQSASSLESMAMMGVASSFPAGYYVSFSLARTIFSAVMNVVILQFATVVGIDLI